MMIPVANQLTTRLQRLQSMYDTTWQRLEGMESRLAEASTSPAAALELQSILDNLATIQPEYQAAIQLWNHDRLVKTPDVRNALQIVQQALHRLLHRTNELHDFAAMKKSSLLPHLGVVAQQHQAQVAYGRISDMSQ